MTEKEIDALAYNAGFENAGTPDLDPSIVPDKGNNWETWNRAWARGRADAQEDSRNIH